MLPFMIELPQRTGPKPRTTDGAPHEQIDQNPLPETCAPLKDKALDFPLVVRRPSIISVSGTEALWLTEVPEHSCAEAFMRGNEFAHVHPIRRQHGHDATCRAGKENDHQRLG